MTLPPGIGGIVDPVDQIRVLRLCRIPWDPSPLRAHGPLEAAPEDLLVQPPKGGNVPIRDVKPQLPPPQVGVGLVRLTVRRGESINVPEVRLATSISMNPHPLGVASLDRARVLELLT